MLTFKNIKIKNKLKLKIHFRKSFHNLLFNYRYSFWKNYILNFKKSLTNIKIINLNIIINYEKYNYNLIDKLYNISKLSILDFCNILGITIPHYCYHPDLSIAGNCRMCLVQIDNSIKPVVACAININPSMVIQTKNILVKKLQENVLEFLLINHPLDCPICDRGGECDLQDITLSYGNERGRLFHKYDFKRSINDMQCNLLVKLVLTRCIYCTRCIRFLNEFGNNYDMGLLGRGFNSEIVYI